MSRNNIITDQNLVPQSIHLLSAGNRPESAEK